MPLVHPLHNVAASRNLPMVDVRHMPERFKFKPDPVRPCAILAGIANEDVRHARYLARFAPRWPYAPMITTGGTQRKSTGDGSEAHPWCGTGDTAASGRASSSFTPCF